MMAILPLIAAMIGSVRGADEPCGFPLLDKPADYVVRKVPLPVPDFPWDWAGTSEADVKALCERFDMNSRVDGAFVDCSLSREKVLSMPEGGGYRPTSLSASRSRDGFRISTVTFGQRFAVSSAEAIQMFSSKYGADGRSDCLALTSASKCLGAVAYLVDLKRHQVDYRVRQDARYYWVRAASVEGRIPHGSIVELWVNNYTRAAQCELGAAERAWEGM